MKSTHELLHGRTRVRRRYALMPLDGFPTSRLPQWRGADVRILAAPALGANFAQYKIDLQPGGGTSQQGDGITETLVYVLGGELTLTVNQQRQTLITGGFALLPAAAPLDAEAPGGASLLVLRKRYQPAAGIEPLRPLVGNESNIRAVPYLDNEHARLQTLVPDELCFDLAMNIFTFDPGHCLPYVETHVMEHGLLFLEGKGVYYLDDEWMEVRAGDFIWMAPFCPQTFYATGDVPARYIYYKNVNRDVEL